MHGGYTSQIQQVLMEQAPEPVRNHPQADSIYKIIQEAQAFEGKDYQKAIDLLDKAKKILPQLNESKAESHQTVANSTIDNASLELTYRSKLANLYYSIREYEQSYNIYKAIIEKIPSNPRLHKAAGDSLRHLERYEEAIWLYQDGIKICSVIRSYSEFQAAILNSMGLAYIAIQQYDKAINKFDTAINISSKNPLYYCNLASTYLNKGDRTKAQNTYEAAAKLLKEPLDSEGLTKDNIKFIDKTLSKFLDNLKKLQQVKSDDPDLNKRINRFGESLTKTMESGLDNAKEIPSQKTPEQEAKLIIDSSKILEMVKSPGKQKLNQFYNGMKTTLEDNYLSARMVKSKHFTLNKGNMATTIASNLAKLIPIIGSQLSSVINFTGNFITQAQLEKQAINIAHISDGVVEFNDLAKDIVLRLIDNNKDYLMGVDPDKNILPAWAESFQKAAKWLKEKMEQFQDSLFGSDFETSMQKYGYKLAIDLVSKYIATGKIYGNDKGVNIRADEMLKRLSHACEDVFKADKDTDKDRVKSKPASQPQEGEKKCQIY